MKHNSYANPRSADWRGALTKRFRWSKFRFEWGRWCYKVDRLGNDKEVWFEWELG